MTTTEQRNLIIARQNNESRVSLTTNSTRSQRLTRKRDTSNSAPRNRSRSREQYQDKDFETFLKHVKTTKTPENHLQKSLQRVRKPQCSASTLEETTSGKATNFKRLRPSIVEQNNLQNTAKKKRQPTPVKSRREINRDNTIDTKNDRQKFQLQIKVAQLENELNIEKTLRIKFSDGKMSLQKTVNHLKEILSQLQIENNILLTEKKGYEQKIKQMQTTILQSEKDLNITKNKLNKLKQTIKENKMSELQSQLKKLTKCNEKFAEKTRKLEAEKLTLVEELGQSNKELTEALRKVEVLEAKVGAENRVWRQSTREQYLSQQVQRLKKNLEKSKEEREKFIEETLQEKDESIFNLKKDIKNLKIQLHFLQKTKDNEITELRNNKESELKKLRVKCSKLVNELRQKQRGNNLKERKENLYPTRSNIVERTSRDHISLSLSPDDHN